MINVVMLSGGKDSVATCLWARRTGLKPVPVYQDTKWEWGGHYKHLDVLEQFLGNIQRLTPDVGFAERVLAHGTFPSRTRRWCTEELKLMPSKAWLDQLRDDSGDDVTVFLGIRREESPKRADPVQTPEREWAEHYDCWVIRPILEWTVAQVILEHKRAGVPMHPLYHRGAERVGCFPCIGASKNELALVNEIMPERVDEIRELERKVGQTMFTRDRRTEKEHLLAAGASAEAAGPSVEPIGIDEVMRWASTDRGGKQILLVRPPSGCARWGICERPPNDSASPQFNAAPTEE